MTTPKGGGFLSFNKINRIQPYKFDIKSIWHIVFSNLLFHIWSGNKKIGKVNFIQYPRFLKAYLSAKQVI